MKLLLVLMLCLLAPTVTASSFDKSEEAMTITIIKYDDKTELLASYNARQQPASQFRNGDTIDGYALFSQTGMTCEIHVYRHPRSKTYENILGHEMRHCIEGNWH